MIYIVISAGILIALFGRLIYLRKQRQQYKASPVQGRNCTVTTVACPKCGTKIQDLVSQHPFAYGTPFRVCPHCRYEYNDQRYYEIALEGTASRQANVPCQAGILKNEIEASNKRLSSVSYALRLADFLYAKGPTLYTGAPRCFSEAQYEETERILRGYLSDRLKKYTDILRLRIGEPFQEFRVNNSVERFTQLTYEAKDSSAVTELVREILCHYDVNPAPFAIQVVYDPSVEKCGGTPRGTFTRGMISGGTIRVIIQPNYSEYDTVIAIALHECAHAFLALHDIRLENTEENELLTDAAAIFLGGGKYILRGYFPSSSFRIGYLRKIECDIIEAEMKSLRESHAHKREAEQRRAMQDYTELTNRIRELLNSIRRKKEDLHPASVVREASQASLLHQLWQESDEWIGKATQFAAKQNDAAKAELKEIRQKTTDGGVIEKRLRQFYDLLIEWSEAEAFQANLPRSALDMIHGIQPLVEGDNAFAILEMIKFWSSCPATRKDAEAYYQKLLQEETADHLCALGICRQKGIHVLQDAVLAEYYLTRAASLGSKDAKSILEQQ